MFFRNGSTGSTSVFFVGGLFVILIDCMIFLSVFLKQKQKTPGGITKYRSTHTSWSKFNKQTTHVKDERRLLQTVNRDRTIVKMVFRKRNQDNL